MCKRKSDCHPNYKKDDTGVFKYPFPWPKPAMGRLIRPHPSGWPSSDQFGQGNFRVRLSLSTPVGRMENGQWNKPNGQPHFH